MVGQGVVGGALRCRVGCWVWEVGCVECVAWAMAGRQFPPAAQLTISRPPAGDEDVTADAAMWAGGGRVRVPSLEPSLCTMHLHASSNTELIKLRTVTDPEGELWLCSFFERAGGVPVC